MKSTGRREGSSLAGSNPIDAKLERHRQHSSKHCPGCGHKLEQKPDWVGLPAGVKFDPTDQELIEHLEAKVMCADHCQPHPLIDEFIATIEGEDGICYTHPEKLPGVTKDGLSKHFFHRPSKAYTTGTRKRRKIQTECDVPGGETRWHKTGKTRPVVVNGKQKGCKKILVLYTNFGKHRKPEKTNWVMHQYHLGQLEEEKEGELVVSKIFYQTQPRQCNWVDKNAVGSDAMVDQQLRDSTAATASGSSSKEAVAVYEHGAEELAAAVVTNFNAVISHTNVPTMKPDHLIGFSSLIGKNFGLEVRMGDVSQKGESSARMCEEQQTGHEQQVAAAAFHMSRPSDPCTIITTPPLHPAASLVLDHPYQQVSPIIHQDGRFAQQQLQQQPPLHHKMGGRTSGLEEMLLGCTSNDMKGETSIGSGQETEWLKYSFWTDPDNSSHHG